jgi:hypothetical protein
MTAVLIVQMCLALNGAPLCSIIDRAEFKSIEDCSTAAAIVQKHTGPGITAMCSPKGRA